jgi:hypothetical protein
MQKSTQKKNSKNTSQKSKNSYKSIYREGYVSESSYIVELLFQKRAEIFNSGRYPERFWNLPKYKGQFTGQVVAASRLLKKYSGQSIINALKSERSRGVIKLQDEKLIKIIEEFEKNKKDLEIVKTEEQEIVDVIKPFSKNRNRLHDL